MNQSIRRRLLTSVLAVGLGASSLSALSVQPVLAQEEPEAPIIPVNQPVSNAGPVVNASDFSVTEGSRGVRDITFSDAEGDAIKQVYWNPVDGFDFEYVNDTTWQLIAKETLREGSYKIDFQAEDASGNFGAIKSITVTVTKRQQPQPTTPPAPGGQGPVVSVQGGTFDNSKVNTISFTVQDPQGDHIHQVWWYPFAGGSLRWVTENKWEISIPKGAPAGKYNLRLWAIDNKGNKGDEVSVPITIVDTNAPAPQPTDNPNPGVNRAPTVQVSSGTYDNRQRNVIPFKVVDPDGDHVSNVWWYPLPNSSLRHVEGNNWEVVMEPGVRPGDYPLRIWAIDDKGNKGEESKATIRVVGNAVNAAPTIQSGRIQMWAGYPYSYKLPVSDPDNDRLTVRIVSGESWMRVDSNNVLHLNPSRRDVGHFRVTLEVSDGKATDRGTFDVYVNRFNP